MREMHRVAVNAWIRESGVFDGAADFDAALRRLRNPDPDACRGRLRRWTAPERLRLLQYGR